MGIQAGFDNLDTMLGKQPKRRPAHGGSGSVDRNRQAAARRSAPSLRQERTIWERFKDDFEDAANRSMVGYAVRRGADYLDWRKAEGETEAQHDARITQAERNRRSRSAAVSERDPVARSGDIGGTIARGASSLLGTMLGGADPTYLIAPGGSAVSRIAGQSVVNAGANAATQGLEIDEGVRDEFDEQELGLEATVGGLFQGGIEGARGLVRGLRNRGSATTEEVLDNVLNPDRRSTPASGGDYVVSPEPRQHHELGETFRRFEKRDDEGNIQEYGFVYDDGPVTRYSPDHEPLPVSRELADSLRSSASGNRRAVERPVGVEEELVKYDDPSQTRQVTIYNDADIEQVLAARQPNLMQRVMADEQGAVPRDPVEGEPGFDPEKAAEQRDRLNNIGQPPFTPAMEKVGSIGPNQGVIPDELKHMVEVEKTPRSVEDTVKAGEELGLDEKNFPTEGKIGDVSAKVAKGARLTEQSGKGLLDAYDQYGPGSDEYAIALEAFLRTAKTHSENSSETGRALNVLNRHVKAAEAQRLADLMNDPREADRLAKLIDKYKDDPDALSKIARDATKPTLRDHLFSLRYNFMLSGPKTHVYNVLGTTGHILGDIATHGFTAALDLPRRAFGANDAVTGREVVARLSGLLAGARASWPNVKLAYKQGRPLDNASRAENSRGPVGDWEVATKAMSAEDEFFRTMAHYSSVYGQAVRQAHIEGLTGDAFDIRVQDLTDLSMLPKKELERIIGDNEETADEVQSAARIALKMVDDADDYAKRMRYQDDPSFLGKGVEMMRVRSPRDTAITSLGKDVVTLIFPFVRTPDSLARTAARYSPLGILEGVNIADWRAGGARRSLAAARVIMGTAVTAQIAMYVADGSVTGEGPRDYKKRQALEEGQDANGNPLWQANSFRNPVTGKWHSYEGLEPLSMLLSGVATTMERWDEGDNFVDKAGVQIFNAAEVVTNQTWLEGLGDFFQAMNGTSSQREGAIDNFLANIASSFVVPAAVRQVNQAYFDDTVRDTRGNDSLEDRVVNRIKSGVPGLSDDLPAQHDSLGREMRRGDALGPDILSRAYSPYEHNDAVAAEMARLMKAHPEGKPVLERVDKSLNVTDFPLGRLTAEEQQDYQMVTGAYIEAMMEEALHDPEYQVLTDDEKREYISDIAKAAREWAREDVFSADEGDEVSAEDAEPEGSETEGEEFTAGVPTSMRRTVEGNRLVRGVENSAHLTGDAIDFVPSPGISFAELYRQAKEFFGPDAEVIWEHKGTPKEHVHVKYPGLNAPYYGERGTV